MNDATCETCPYMERKHPERAGGQCHRNAPVPSPDDSCAWWPYVDAEKDWCVEHPDRQPHLEADMRRIVDALEKMASRAARAKS